MCWTHGGNLPSVRAKARERVALAAAVQENAGLSPADTLMKTTATARALLDREIEAAGTDRLSLRQLARIADTLALAGRLASAAVAAGLDATWLELQSRAAVAAQSDIVERILRGLLIGLGHDWDDAARRLIGLLVDQEADVDEATRERLRRETRRIGAAAAAARRQRDHDHQTLAVEAEALRARVAELEEVVDRQRAAIARRGTGLPELPPGSARPAAGFLGEGGIEGVARWAGGS